MTPSENWYRGREQTLVKHHFLKDYLAALANIVGRGYSSITYVDCFSGPWKAASQRYEDTSFGIAIAELRKARQQLKEQFNRDVRMRCFFIEKNHRAYQELSRFLATCRDPGFEFEAKNGRFEDLINPVVEFVSKARNTFPFFFIDPRGWKAVAIKTLRPLLSISPSEVLINLMTSHLHRFVKTQNLRDLFDSEVPANRLAGLRGQDLDDEIVSIYSDQLHKVAGFQHVCAAVILRSSIDTPHYRLIYGTRNALGLAKFKESEKRAMKKMEPARAEAKLRKSEERTSQSELFAGNEIYDSGYYRQLRERYLSRSHASVVQLLTGHKIVPYDTLWKIALSVPLVFESDLKEWLDSDPKIKLCDLKGDRGLKFGRGHGVVMSE